jgi:hypothetical protein
MKTVARPKKTAPRSRCATPEELEDEARRWQSAKAKPAQATKPEEGNLAAVLVMFARWRRCCCCQALVLYVGADCRTTGDVECPTCQGIRADLAKRLKPSPGSCQHCGSLAIFVDESLAHPRATCGGCLATWSALEPGKLKHTASPAAKVSRPSLPARVALHLWGLFATSTTSNDNAQVPS